MKHLLPERCPTCGQPWPQDARRPLTRLFLSWLPRLALGATIVAVACASIGLWLIVSQAR